MRVMQAALPHMRKANQGYFITVTSTSGLRGVPCFEYYSGSKFALEGITDSMRYSLAELNISMVRGVLCQQCDGVVWCGVVWFVAVL